MTEIRQMDMGANKLSGTLPDSWSAMTKMTTYVHSFIHLFIRSFVHSFIRSFVLIAKPLISRTNSVSSKENFCGTKLMNEWNSEDRSCVSLKCVRLCVVVPSSFLFSLYSRRFIRFLFFASLSLLPTRRLCMMFNHISGTLPKAWSRMTRMRTLDLMMNRYTLPLYRSTTLPFYHSLLPFYCGTQSTLVQFCVHRAPHRVPRIHV